MEARTSVKSSPDPGSGSLRGRSPTKGSQGNVSTPSSEEEQMEYLRVHRRIDSAVQETVHPASLRRHGRLRGSAKDQG